MRAQTLIRVIVCGTVVTAVLGIVLPEAAWAGLGEPVPMTTPDEAVEAFMASPACAKLLGKLGCTKGQEDLISAEMSKRFSLMGGGINPGSEELVLFLALLFAAVLVAVLVVAGIFYGIGWAISELCSPDSEEEPEIYQRQGDSSGAANRRGRTCSWCGGTGCYDDTPGGRDIPCPRCGGRGWK
jgi:hypothetical protein